MIGFCVIMSHMSCDIFVGVVLNKNYLIWTCTVGKSIVCKR